MAEQFPDPVTSVPVPSEALTVRVSGLELASAIHEQRDNFLLEMINDLLLRVDKLEGLNDENEG